MAKIARVKMRWQGFIGSPGYSIFHFRDFAGADPITSDAEACIDKVDAFAEAIKSKLPNVASLQVQSDVEVLEDTTGELQYILTGTPAAAHAGGGAFGSPYAAATGAVISWRTDAVVRGRRLRGRTFLVPLAGSAFEGNGTLDAGSITAFTTAATALSDSTSLADLCIWARPSAPGATDGQTGLVNGFSIPDMSAVLRSRRD